MGYVRGGDFRSCLCATCTLYKLMLRAAQQSKMQTLIEENVWCTVKHGNCMCKHHAPAVVAPCSPHNEHAQDAGSPAHAQDAGSPAHDGDLDIDSDDSLMDESPSPVAPAASPLSGLSCISTILLHTNSMTSFAAQVCCPVEATASLGSKMHNKKCMWGECPNCGIEKRVHPFLVATNFKCSWYPPRACMHACRRARISESASMLMCQTRAAAWCPLCTSPCPTSQSPALPACHARPARLSACPPH